MQYGLQVKGPSRLHVPVCVRFWAHMHAWDARSLCTVGLVTKNPHVLVLQTPRQPLRSLDLPVKTPPPGCPPQIPWGRPFSGLAPQALLLLARGIVHSAAKPSRPRVDFSESLLHAKSFARSATCWRLAPCLPSHGVSLAAAPARLLLSGQMCLPHSALGLCPCGNLLPSLIPHPSLSSWGCVAATPAGPRSRRWTTGGERKQGRVSSELEDTRSHALSLYERRQSAWMGNKEAVVPSLPLGGALRSCHNRAREILGLLQLCTGEVITTTLA